LGADGAANVGLNLALTLSGAGDQYGLYCDNTVNASGTSQSTALFARFNLTNASFTCPSGSAYWAYTPTKGASATLTRYTHFLAQGASTVATNNAIFADNIAYTGNWAINIASTAASTLAGDLTVGGNLTITGGFVYSGVIDGSNAAAGKVGEAFRSVVSTPTNAAATSTYLALTSITLTPGDWDISAIAYMAPAGATVVNMLVGIGTTSASATGLVFGDNAGELDWPSSTSNSGTVSIPGYRVNITVSTTYYLNVRVDRGAGTPTWQGRISARRVR
jgi:hypothetical protein